jgi:hypothetical protein
MAAKFKTHDDMISWQFRELIAELQEVEAHAGAIGCPCDLADIGEY